MLENGAYIPSIDGKDLYLSNHYIFENPVGYKLRTQTGDLNFSRFINKLDYSLDLIKLQEVYESVYRRKNFSFNRGGKDFTQRIINVTFKYNVKTFNKIRGNIYVKYGYNVDKINFINSVAVENGELVGIETEVPVETPVSNDILGKLFYYQDGMYKAKTNIPIIKGVADIRSEIYRDGFICDGIKYIRFKRSSGSSRVGKCLFIDEKLYNKMHKWEMCGIKVKAGQSIDLAALEPYIALTLSSIVGTLDIHPENILVIDDYKSVFRDRAIATRLVDGRLVSAPEDVEISNSIWDGQSLMDRSIFLAYQKKEQLHGKPDAKEHGMLLLRARFFKSCCFNCNIQKWFADNGINNISQLNGQTTASKIEDIKLITTPSSIKYLKFGTLDTWLEILSLLSEWLNTKSLLIFSMVEWFRLIIS